MTEVLQVALLFLGCLFFGLGTLGLFRFPDTLTRIHALTKADNLGLGLIVLALLPGVTGWAVAVKILLVWVVALVASATSAHLVARALSAGEEAGSD
ncbi:MAG: Na+/H+ antiporter subunit G [Haliea sp.]|nr:Na+/H+ antiporter subunit G [Haliea sp.]|tara:strand:+ start:47239 stop:47529 length:291 start_codon:yes stop_codon:yes gene_type:complete